jgi:XTP/dITP diphosphohydrolase
MPGSRRLWFATSNDHKFEEAKLVLGEFGIVPERLKAKGTEIQSEDVSRIASAAALETFRKFGRRLFAEDTGLFVNQLGGFPGPYAAYVCRTIGPAALASLLRSGADMSAEFVSAVAYSQGLGEPKVFVGRLKGRIARRARGTGGFGFDPIFISEGETRTLAELSIEEKCKISHRARALRKFGAWLRSRTSR